jgi:hypothetical protein
LWYVRLRVFTIAAQINPDELSAGLLNFGRGVGQPNLLTLKPTMTPSIVAEFFAYAKAKARISHSLESADATKHRQAPAVKHD